MATIEQDVLDESFDTGLDIESVKSWAVHAEVTPRAGWLWAVPAVFWMLVIAASLWTLADHS